MGNRTTTAAANADPAMAFLPARASAPASTPWVALGPGKSFKPLRFLSRDRGFVELLRLDPGTEIALHRHTGEVHAWNLEGTRHLRTGEVIGPGDYVYEPAGNIDSWKVVGEVPLVVLVVVNGAVEYLDAARQVTSRYTAATLLEIYRRHCAAAGIEPLDLVD